MYKDSFILHVLNIYDKCKDKVSVEKAYKYFYDMYYEQLMVEENEIIITEPKKIVIHRAIIFYEKSEEFEKCSKLLKLLNEENEKK